MNNAVRIAIVVALLGAVGVVIALKTRGGAEADPHAGAGLPRLLELGSTTCIPCKAMKPILEELKTECAGKFQVELIDVHKDEAAAEAHDVRIIPTQVFLDASGKELFRHEGFFAKEDILAKWKELGVE